MYKKKEPVFESLFDPISFDHLNFINNYIKENNVKIKDNIKIMVREPNYDKIAMIKLFCFDNNLSLEIVKRIIKKTKKVRIPYEIEATSVAIRKYYNYDTSFNVLNYILKEKMYSFEKLSSMYEEKRLEHVISVAKLSYYLAKENDLEYPNKAFIAGLLHDLGKQMDYYNTAKVKHIMEKEYSQYLDLPKFSFHQFTSEFLAKKVFKIEDEEVLKAIRFHCTGNKNMSKLDKIIYVSDKLDPLRGYNSSEMIKMCNEDITKGFLFVLNENIKYIKSKITSKDDNSSISNRLTVACLNEYLQDKTFLNK